MVLLLQLIFLGNKAKRINLTINGSISNLCINTYYCSYSVSSTCYKYPHRQASLWLCWPPQLLLMPSFSFVSEVFLHMCQHFKSHSPNSFIDTSNQGNQCKCPIETALQRWLSSLETSPPPSFLTYHRGKKKRTKERQVVQPHYSILKLSKEVVYSMIPVTLLHRFSY